MSRPATGDRTPVIRNGTMIGGSGRAPTPNDAPVVEGNRIRSIKREPRVSVGDLTRSSAAMLAGSFITDATILAALARELRSPAHDSWAKA